MTVHRLNCRRFITRKSLCPAARPAHRRAFRRSLRRVMHPARRRVLPYTGPSFRQVLSVVNKYLKAAEAFRKTFNPAWNEGRFQMLRSPEECDRLAEQDLKRIYGDGTPAARELEAYASAKPPPPPGPPSAPSLPLAPTSLIPTSPVPSSPLQSSPVPNSVPPASPIRTSLTPTSLIPSSPVQPSPIQPSLTAETPGQPIKQDLTPVPLSSMMLTWYQKPRRFPF
jgi:hypothetical protein